MIKIQIKINHAIVLLNRTMNNQPIIYLDQNEEVLLEQGQMFAGGYNTFRINRVRKLRKIFGDEWFKGKKILEVGCAFGNIGLFFKSLGADVTFAEGRKEHLNVVRSKDPKARLLVLDQDKDWSLKEHYDLIIHFSVLYNLENWQRDLLSSIKFADYVALETAVANTTQNFELKIKENIYGGQGSVHGIGTMVSASTIEKVISSSGAQYTRYDDADLNDKKSFFDWQAQDVDLMPIAKNITQFRDPKIYGGRRFWIISYL